MTPIYREDGTKLAERVPLDEPVSCTAPSRPADRSGDGLLART